MAFQRVEITAKVVRDAIAAAAERRPGTNVWADTKLPYLIVRQRSAAVKWTVKAMKTMRAIGDVRERHAGFLSVTDARKRATEVYTELRYGSDQEGLDSDEEPAAWTVSQVCLKYQAMMARPRWVNGRTKPASRANVDDIRSAFSHDAVQVLGPMLVTDLTRPIVYAARDAITPRRKDAGVYSSKSKFIVWFKAALSWAADTHPDDSGLVDGADRWWERLNAGEPSGDEQKAIAARRKLRLDRKKDLDVESIGAVMARHEEYCAGRTGRDMIGPGVRYGLWWVNFTANRRFTTVQLERANLLEQDPFGEPGWGRAMWAEDQMKAKEVFWLPLPPAVRDIALHSITDFTRLVDNEHGGWPTRWVFASTRRYGRDPDNDDVSTYPNSLNAHLGNMRAAGALDGLPYYSLHLARAAMTKFLEKNVSPRASSITLAHALKDTSDEEMSPTTRDFYSVSQHMEEKAVAMRAWSDKLIEAFLKAGGKMPAPSVKPRLGKVRKQA